METLRALWNTSCLAAGIPAISPDTSARILAVLYVHGNNEGFVSNKNLLDDIDYIKAKFHVDGGETPDADFACKVRRYIGELEAYMEEHRDEETKREALFHSPIPQWAKDLFLSRYNLKLIN